MSNNLEWDGDRFEWAGERCKPAIEAEVSSASHYAPWIEFGGIDPQELCRRWNYHDRLREALREVTAILAWVAHGECRAIQDDPIMPSAQAQEVARAILAELNNLEPKP